MTSKQKWFHKIAREIVESAPAKLGQDAIIAHVGERLIKLHTEWRVEGAADARESMLREQLAIVRGLEQDARSRVQTIERELAEHLARAKKVTT